MTVSSSPAPPDLPVDVDTKLSPLNPSDDSTWMGTMMTEVLRFRDALGLTSRCGSIALNELLMGTLEDLKTKFPKYSSCIQISEVNHECLHQGLLLFNKVLKSIGDSWLQNSNHSTNFSVQEVDLQTLSEHQLAESALEMLKYMVSRSREMIDHMEMVSSNVSVAENLQSQPFSIGETPKGYLKPDVAHFPPVPSPLRFQAVGKLQPVDGKHVSFQMFPLLLDHSPHLVLQKDQSEFPKALMNIELNQPALIEIDGYIDDISWLSEPTSLGSAPSTPKLHLTKEAPGYTLETPPSTPRPISHIELMSSMTHFKRVNMGCFSDPVNMTDGNGDDRNSSSEAKVFSLPILQLGESGVQSPTPTPPASPMVLAGLFMPFSPSGHAQFSKEQPSAYMAMSNFGHGDGRKASESILVESHPSEHTLHPKSPLGKSEFPPSPDVSQAKSPLAQSQPLPPLLLPVLPTAAPNPLLHLQSIPEGSVPPLPPPPPLRSSAKIVPAPPPPTPRGDMLFTHIPPPPPPPPPPSPPGASVQSTSPPLPTTPGSSSSGPLPPPQPPGVIAHTKPPPPPLPPKNPRHSGTFAPPPPPSLKGSAPSAPSPPLLAQGGLAPPLPAMRALRAKVTKLKRSTQMGNLYRLLKRKLEGSNMPGKASNGKKGQTGTSGGKKGGQGMADALAEMTKRSSYFQHIEEDVQKYSVSILEMKSGISNFRTKDMAELQKFYQDMEKHLEELTDETQVLGRFEGFPFKKLESIRMAVKLYMRLDGIITTLKTWEMAHPVAKELDKIESYFTKIKKEVDAIERSKDEESKTFQSNNIEFDFGILMRIKEVMIDLSSNCIEMALKESKDLKEEGEDPKAKSKHNPSKLLWRAFQLAFRVYNFAGGQDERADRLTSELAREIEAYSRS